MQAREDDLESPIIGGYLTFPFRALVPILGLLLAGRKSLVQPSDYFVRSTPD